MSGLWKAARLRRRIDRPSPVLQSVVRRLRGHLEAAPGGALTLIEIGSAEWAAVAVAALADRLSAEGKRVVIADAADGRPLSRILRSKGAPGTFRTASVNGQPVGLYVAPQDPTLMADPGPDPDADATVVLATVDPAVGADHLAPWASQAVVMIRAGEATAPRIDGIARQLRHAGISILSGLLVGTDPDDHSSGVPAGRSRPSDPADHLLETLQASGQ